MSSGTVLSGTRAWRSRINRLIATTAIVGAGLVFAPFGAVPTASAVDGDAQPELTVKTVDLPTATPGQLITYAINYTCSNNNNQPPIDGCDGAVFTDPIPKFTNIYGQQVPLEFVSASTTTVWPSMVLDTTDPANPFVTGTAAAWAPGTSGTIFITARVPSGTVPVASQPVTNQATVTDPVAPVDLSTQATTTISATAPTWTVDKSGPPNLIRMNRDYQWAVAVCGPATSSLWPIYDITDTLPPGAQYVTSDFGGVYTDDGTTPLISDGAGTVTWHFDAANPPPLGSDGCFRMHVTARYPSGYLSPSTPDPDDDNVADASKVNSVTGTGKNLPADVGTGIGTDTYTNQLLGPVLGTLGTAKTFTDLGGGSNFYVQTGDIGAFNLSGSIDSDFPVDSFILSDGRWSLGPPSNTSGTGMPPSFVPTSVVPGTWNAPITATIEGSNDNFATAGVPIAAGVASGDPVIPVGPFSSIRWIWAGAPNSGFVPANFAATGQRIIGVIGTVDNTPGLYTNISSLTILHGNDAPAVTEANDQYILEAPLPHPGITKDVSNTSRRPGQTATYTIGIGNSADATGPLTNPVISDCVPQFFILQGAPTAPAPWSVGPVPTCGPGQTPIGYTFVGTLTPGQSSPNITYTVLVAPSDPGPIAPLGNYTNTATITPSGGGSFAHCSNTNPVCGSTKVVNVPPTVELASHKCVTGDLDAGIFRPSPGCQTDPGGPFVSAQTVPGGGMTWQLTLQNTGNTLANNVDFIDIFPYVGDKAVIANTGGVLNNRNTEWTPYLVTPIIALPGWIVSYSTSATPCRPEVGGVNNAGVSCQAPNWVVNPPLLDLPNFKSVKFHFNGTLAIGDTATFEWDMRAPVLDPTYDQAGIDPVNAYEFVLNCTAQTPPSDPTHCPRAVNSFAYGADATGLPQGTPAPGRLFAEPPQVEIRVVDPPGANRIGDRVWFDRNFDGIQGADTTTAGEPGVAGVYVELFSTADPTTPLFTTFTDVNGNYLFSNGGLGLPDDDYFVRFYPPAGYYVSPQDQTGGPIDEGAPDIPGQPGQTTPGTNTNDDSDVPRVPTGSNPTGSYHDTTTVTLGENDNMAVPSVGEFDPTWDMGLWRAAPAIDVVKVTKDSAWADAQAGDGVAIVQGRPVTWIYTVTNTGNARLENVDLTDNGGPDPTFTVSACSLIDDGDNADGSASSVSAPIALNRGAIIRCTATGTAARTNYSNTATVIGTPVTDDGLPLVPGPTGFPVPPTVTDSDPSSYVSGKYDLALAKTVAAYDPVTGNVPFTITVRNEGTVPSGPYSVTDVLPIGMWVASSVPPASSSTGTSATGVTLVWNVATGIAVGGADVTFVVNAHIDNFLASPYRNYAEISADSSGSVQTGGVATPTTDSDSTPDALIGNDNTVYGPVGTPTAGADNVTIVEAGTVAFPNSGDDTLDGQDDADIADIDPTIVYDLALAKDGPATPVPAGSDPVFTVRVYNQSNVPSGPVVMRDQLPVGLSLDSVGSTAGCVPAPGNQVLCTLSSIPVGGSTLLTIASTIDDIAGGSTPDYSTAPWRNWAEVDSDSGLTLYGVGDVDSTPETTQGNGIIGGGAGDPYVAIPTAGPTYATPTGTDEDDNDDAIAAAGAAYDLAVIKTADATALTQNADAAIEYTITVVNQGDLDSGAYTITDTLPAGLTVVAPVADGGVVDTSATPATVTWTGTNLVPLATKEYTLNVTVADVTKRPFRNTVEISDDSAQELFGVNDIDSTPDADPTNDNAGNGVVGGDGYGPIGSPASGGVDNLTPADAGNGNDGEDDADVADVDLPLNDGYDLAIAKTVDAATVAFDDTITYTITIQNQGVLDSREFTVTDIVPPGLTVTGLDGAVDNGDGTVTWTIANLDAGDVTTRALTVEIADITLRPFRNFAEITTDSSDYYSVGPDVVHDVDSTPDTDETNDGAYGPVGTAGPIDNLDPNAIGQAGVGPDPEDDADIADIDAPVTYDLALVKTGPGSMDPEGTGTFTITVANQGNVPSGIYTVTDTVPAGMVVTAASIGGTFPDPAATVTWTDLPSIDPGETATLTVTMRIADLTLRPFHNFAEITADSADMYSTPNDTIADIDSVPDDLPTSAVDTTVFAEAGVGADAMFDDEDVADLTTDVIYDLALAKMVDAPAIAFDGSAVFTVTVQNQGNVASGPFTVTDTLPAGLTVGAISDSGALVGSTITWNLQLAAGASKDLTVAVTIADITKRPFLNVAEITADSSDLYSTPGDPVTDDDSTPADPETSADDNMSITEAGAGDDGDYDDEDVAALDVPVTYDLALIKRLPAGQNYKVGSLVRFEIVVKNQGNVPSGVYSVHDVVPVGLTPVGTSDSGVVSGATVTWTDLPSLAPGATVVLTVDVRMDDSSRPSYINTAEIIDDSADVYSTPITTVHDIDSTPDLDPSNDALVDTDNVDANLAGDEDDHDVAALDVNEVLVDNAPPVPSTTTPPTIPPVTTPSGGLPSTGSNVADALIVGVALFLLGAGLRMLRRRPRRAGAKAC